MSRAAVAEVVLPRRDGTLIRYAPAEPRAWPRPHALLESRSFLAAVHVVCDPWYEPDGSGRARLDWDATLAFREHVWSWGLGVAEAMDTAQRGMGLDWAATQELIRRTAAAAGGRRLACGAGTDQLGDRASSLNAVLEAYLEQCALVEGAGAQPVIMASRALAALAHTPDDYRAVYDCVLGAAGRPVILHWLGEMFDPQLAGYWGASDPARAMDTVVELIRDHAAVVDGIKVSLLDASLEVELRRRLPEGVRLYTGDDYHYPELVRGDEQGHSDALLGIFAAIVPAASAALQALDAGDGARSDAILEPTVPLARQVFASPTFNYKTGIVFLAYLNGHQPHFRMVGGLESARSPVDLAETFVLADQAGLLEDPELAVERMRRVLAVAGIEP